MAGLKMGVGTDGTSASGLKWALGVSVVLNLFLIAGAITGVVVVHQHMSEMPRPPSSQAWDEVEKHLSPASRAHIRKVVETAALGTESDWVKARDLRSQAETLAGQDHYDAARIVDLAEQARSYENMSRAKIETALIQDMATLPPSERGVVAGYILRPGFRLRHLLIVGQPAPGQSHAASQTGQTVPAQ